MRLSLAVAVAFSLTGVTSAWAFHYASVGEGDNPNGAHGAFANLCVGHLWVWTGHDNGHVNNTMWVGFNLSATDIRNTRWWTDVGLANGIYSGNNGYINTNGAKLFYWADNSGAYGFNIHFFSDGPIDGDFHPAQVTYCSPPWWYVQIAGHYSFGSYHNTSVTNTLAAGLEFLSTNTGYEQESGSSANMEWEDTYGNFYDGWRNPSQEVDSPAGGYWTSTSWDKWREELGSGWSC